VSTFTNDAGRSAGRKLEPLDRPIRQLTNVQINTDATQITGGTGDVMIEVTKMHKYFGDFHALKNIDLKVGLQEVVVVIGPSGSDKSTLIRCINRTSCRAAR
jgi:general L-amino acid transport system ATP-binding protein